MSMKKEEVQGFSPELLPCTGMKVLQLTHQAMKK